ncbi:ATPase AAA [Actinoplanes ianthinogenes]|uniref:ATPase AAA n=1 Tax=Actinoplanes ianthinogenes TaxID=122358 RepID=A0ABN6CQB1_9ACTN|nr:AAA family ATPase [Actinoplanes ianthinogenes]BCJ47408.1 ATPase AAA [Actinoplanes ianthinogenes]GGR01611.1 ATPase AAA [Actinoplanes ianthinogenes]
MGWHLFTGSGRVAEAEAWRGLPQPPPWRSRKTAIEHFILPAGLLDAVNAALHLRRPLLLSGAPGSGKSTLVNLIAAELALGDPLNWHVTSRSTLGDALYQYDALGRLHATQAGNTDGDTRVDKFITLGPLGTALADPNRPRAVLIDEIDKSDLDLPGDLLNVLEQGEFDIPALVRDESDLHAVRGADRATYEVRNGTVRRTHWPIIVLTSNNERSFPAPFLRRCVRFEMPTPNVAFVKDVVAGYLHDAAETERAQIEEFTERLVAGENLALDQLLNFVFLVSGEANDASVRKRLKEVLLAELSGK